MLCELAMPRVCETGCARAGYETTASALAFTVHCLAANPDKCERLLQVRALAAFLCCALCEGLLL